MGWLVYSMGELGTEVIQGKCVGNVPGQAACSKGERQWLRTGGDGGEPPSEQPFSTFTFITGCTERYRGIY